MLYPVEKIRSLVFQEMENAFIQIASLSEASSRNETQPLHNTIVKRAMHSSKSALICRDNLADYSISLLTDVLFCHLTIPAIKTLAIDQSLG